MRCALLVVSLGLLAGCPSSKKPEGPGGPDTLTLPYTPRPVGFEWTKVDDMSTTIEVTTGGAVERRGGRRHHRTDTKVLAVDADGVVTKVSVTYSERTDIDLGPEGESTRPTPVLGKTYTVWREGDELRATRADGAEASSEELLVITLDQDDLGKPPVTEQLLARTWTRGVKVDLTADELARLAEASDGPRQTATSFTLQGVADGVATFAMTTRLELRSPPIAMDVTGTALFDARTGWPRRLELAGPVSGELAGQKLAGQMSGLVTYTYVTP